MTPTVYEVQIELVTFLKIDSSYEAIEGTKGSCMARQRLSLCLTTQTKLIWTFIKAVQWVGYKGERLDRFPRGLHKTKIKSSDFTEIFDFIGSRKVTLYF
jgi:hypothetical protein